VARPSLPKPEEPSVLVQFGWRFKTWFSFGGIGTRELELGLGGSWFSLEPLVWLWFRLWFRGIEIREFDLGLGNSWFSLEPLV
jgi:hypothetical protein